MKTKLQKTIMRRVYYSFAVRTVTEPMLWQGFVLGVCAALFGRLVHVAAVVRNLEATKVENVPNFIWGSFINAFTGGEVLTALVALFMVVLSAKFFYRAVPALFLSRKLQAA